MMCKRPLPNGECRLKLKWTERALLQLIHAEDYIAKDNPAAAQALPERIADAARLEGTGEWVVKQTPYLLVYPIE